MKYRILSILCLGFILSYGNAFAGDLVIGNYTLVSKQRMTRTDYLYTYNADITNNGADATNVTATLTSNSPNTIVVTGVLTFGNVAAGATVTSSDTFSIRQNRSYPFDESALVWDVQSLPPDPGEAGKATLEGIDSDNDGVRDDIQRYIALTYVGQEDLIKALRHMAIYMQKFLLDAENKEKNVENFKAYSKASQCSWALMGKNALLIGRELRARFHDTEERIRTYSSASAKLSGESFSLVPRDAACD